MERVTDSVQQILSECKDMLNETKNCEFVDIYSLSRTLEKQCNELRQVFDFSPDDEQLLKAKKQAVEATAIRLEFYMVTRLGVYEERYKLRQYAKKMYEDCRYITLQLAKDQSINGMTVETWGAWTNWALGFWSRSLHILFETSEDDNRKIKEIVENLNIQKERLNYIG